MRAPRPKRQTCRVRGCDEPPALHTLLDFDFAGDQRREHVRIALDLCAEHMAMFQDAETRDELYVTTRRECTQWEAY